MNRPSSLLEQYVGRSAAELRRGSGWWPWQSEPCCLEPPWEPFDHKSLGLWDCYYNEWEGACPIGLLQSIFTPPVILPSGQLIALTPLSECYENLDTYEVISIAQFPEDKSTIPKAEQFLLGLSHLNRPASFEIVGLGPEPRFDIQKGSQILRNGSKNLSEAITHWTEPSIRVQFSAHGSDIPTVHRLLLSHYPNSAVLDNEVSASDLFSTVDLRHDCHARGSTSFLDTIYCLPLRIYTRLDPDPLAVALSAMDQLGRREWAVLQVLFQPSTQPWAANLEDAVRDPYKPGGFLLENDELSLMREKLRSPLFAVSVRLLSSSQNVYNQLEGWAAQFQRPPQQFQFVTADCDAEDGPKTEYRTNLETAVGHRCTFRPGMLLNVQELASLVHLPGESIASEHLLVQRTRTRRAPQVTGDGSIILGENVHQGRTRTARISQDLRFRHCYIAGASGTGKSTLLLNLIMQDIVAGRGVGILDPHGDLVEQVLERIPEERIDDVILFDPTDEQYPFALNVLDAAPDEHERITAEIVMAIERFFSGGGHWGHRLERILTTTIKTVLNAVPGATLYDVEQMLVDEAFRRQVVPKVRDARLRQFWTDQYGKTMKRDAADPVLNKLSLFLLHDVVRNIVCQRRSSINFDDLMNGGKILLANLAAGRIGEKIANTFGTFLVTKLYAAALRRETTPLKLRRPWYLYVDEFQTFMNLSVGFEKILTEARKFRLCLAGMANQFVGQLTPGVRQAIFGVAGVIISFRLGVDDAQLLAKELQVFSADEIKNLRVGEALVRPEASSQSYNLMTFPDPALPLVDPAPRIRERARTLFSRPKAEVDKELSHINEDTVSLGSDEPPASDPNESDLMP